MSHKLFLALALTLVLAGGDVFALGLGGLRTQSALNQPFLGEIDLIDVKPDELDTVKVSIAPSHVFAKAGIDRYHYLTKLRFTPQLSPQGKPVVRVTSEDPLREPYMDFLVEAVWPQGELVKGYTVLLDPPVTTGRRAPPVTPPVAPSRPGALGSRPAQAGTAPASRAATSSTQTAGPVPVSAPGEGFPLNLGPVQSGMGLWRLALRAAPEGATVAQTAMALYRNNQHAFIDGDINRLIVGKRLVIPSQAELLALNPDAADREFRAALQGEAVRRTPLTELVSGQGQDGATDRLKIAGATPEGSVPPKPAAGTGGVETTPAAPPPAPAQDMEEELLLVMEASESTRQETVELKDRIRELETQLSDIQRLLQLRNTELARLRGTPEPQPGSPAAVGVPTVPVPTTVEPAPLSGTEQPAERPAEQPPEDKVTPTAGGSPVGQAPSPVVTTVAPPTSEPAQPAATPPSATPKPKTTAADDSAAPDRPDTAKTVGVQESSAEASSTWNALLLPLAGFAGLVALGVIGFSWLSARRRGRGALGLDEDSVDLAQAGENASAATGMAAGTASQSAGPHPDQDSVNKSSSVFASFGHFDTEADEADVLSEADIYIAYGRYSEAEELLRGELKRSPDRLDLKLKLAEAHGAGRNVQALRELMQTIQAAGGDRSEPQQWQRLVEMAAALEAGGPPEDGTAVPARPDQAARSVTVDSTDVGMDDLLSLDISDIQRPSLGLGFAPERQAVSLGKSTPLVAPPVVDDEMPLVFEEDALDQALTLPPISEVPGLDKDPLAGLGIGGSVESASELVLRLDDLPASELNLDSVIDSGLVTDSTLLRDERIGVAPVQFEGSPRAAGEGMVAETLEMPPPQESEQGDFQSSQWHLDSGLWDENATKLDLARAYMEMDDGEAARGILEEVIAEGREEQRREAQTLLSRLA